jgi:hypothetical protein
MLASEVTYPVPEYEYELKSGAAVARIRKLYTQRDHISRYVWGVGRPCTHYECGSAYVCFAPKATEFLRGNEMTRWATRRLMRCSKQSLYSITSSARARKDSGMVNPSALALF